MHSTASNSSRGSACSSLSARITLATLPAVHYEDVATSYRMAHGLMKVFSKMYRRAVRYGRAVPAPDLVFRSVWGESLKAACAADRSRSMSTTNADLQSRVRPSGVAGTICRLTERCYLDTLQPDSAGVLFTWPSRAVTLEGEAPRGIFGPPSACSCASKTNVVVPWGMHGRHQAICGRRFVARTSTGCSTAPVARLVALRAGL